MLAHYAFLYMLMPRGDCQLENYKKTNPEFKKKMDEVYPIYIQYI